MFGELKGQVPEFKGLVVAGGTVQGVCLGAGTAKPGGLFALVLGHLARPQPWGQLRCLRSGVPILPQARGAGQWALIR